MRPFPPLLLLLGGIASVAPAAQTSVNVFWTDNFALSNAISDSGGTALLVGDAMQVGYFAGVDPGKDPATYTQADWDSFVALTGDGSLNPGDFGTSIIGCCDGAPPGFFSTGFTFFTDQHNGVPTVAQRIGIRFYDAPTVQGSNNYNTVTANGAGWVLPAPGVDPNVPFPAFASMDEADLAGALAWEGTPFRTDLVPGVVAPDLVLTSVALLDPTTLEISWSGGDGSNDIETSTDGTTWTSGPSGVSSPATITVDPGTTTTLLVRVVEP